MVNWKTVLILSLAWIFLVTSVSADSAWCTPSTGVNVTIEQSGNWTNITVITDDCPVCIDVGFGPVCSYLFCEVPELFANAVALGSNSIYLYVFMGLASIGLALYGLWDLQNRYYANIAALFMASIIAAYLSTVVSNGTLQYGYVVNQSSGATVPIIVQDAGLGWLILIPAVAGMLVTGYLIYDAYMENKRGKEEG